MRVKGFVVWGWCLVCVYVTAGCALSQSVFAQQTHAPIAPTNLAHTHTHTHLAESHTTLSQFVFARIVSIAPSSARQPAVGFHSLCSY